MQLKRVSLVIIVAVTFMGCATMFTGTTKNVFIDTRDKKEVSVRLEKKQKGYKSNGLGNNWFSENLIIPKTVNLRKGEKYRICSTTQDDSACMNIDRTFNGVFLVNLLFGGVIGMIVDASSGAVFSFDDIYVYALPLNDNKSINK